MFVAVEARKGLGMQRITIVGEPGAGKSTLARASVAPLPAGLDLVHLQSAREVADFLDRLGTNEKGRSL